MAAAKENAIEAGVDGCISFIRADVRNLSDLEIGISDSGAPIIISNLPYGERIGSEEENRKIYKALRNYQEHFPETNMFLLTADKELERAMGRKANRRRKLYNGNIETTYYQFHGVK